MAGNFDGSSFIDMNGLSNFTIGTIAAWVRVATLPAAGDVDLFWTFHAAGELEQYPTHDKQMMVYDSGAGAYRLVARVYDGAAKTAQNTTLIASDTWYHAGMTFSNADDLRIWLDGVNETTTVLTADSFSYTDPDFRFAGLANSVNLGETTRTRLIGDLAEFAMWNRVLTSAEMALLAARFSPMFLPDGLQVYVPYVRELTELRSGLALTNTGTTAAVHPRIMYPASPLIVTAPPSAVGAEQFMVGVSQLGHSGGMVGLTYA